VGDAGEGERIAGQRARRRIHHRPAARVLEEEDLVLRDLLVHQAEVVEVRVEVLPHPAEVGEADRLSRARLVPGRRRLHEHHLEVDEQVLVGQRHADLVRPDRPKHGLHLSRERTRHLSFLFRRGTLRLSSSEGNQVSRS